MQFPEAVQEAAEPPAPRITQRAPMSHVHQPACPRPWATSEERIWAMTGTHWAPRQESLLCYTINRKENLLKNSNFSWVTQAALFLPSKRSSFATELSLQLQTPLLPPVSSNHSASSHVGKVDHSPEDFICKTQQCKNTPYHLERKGLA